MGKQSIMQSINNIQELRQQFPWLHLLSESDIAAARNMGVAMLMEDQECRSLFANIFPGSRAVPVISNGFTTAIECGGELVQLAEPVPAPETANLLTLLKSLLAQLPITLQKLFREAWATGPTSTLADLASQFPQCTVVCVQQCRFTSLVEEALRTGDLPAAAATLCENITTLQNSLRVPELAGAVRKTLTALTTLVIGQHNVVKQLVDTAKEEPYDELWQRWGRCTRHYCSCIAVATKDVTASLAHDLQQGAPLVTVRCEDAEMPYGFQYVRRDMLVMTPLTQEAYRTSFSALQQGTVLALGPAGTGKTETQKDFAEWALGYSSVVINCSDALDQSTAKALLQAMQALPQLYFIFDEFNRCEAEALSTILRGAVSYGVARRLNVAFTMNPGYSGRTAMPEVDGIGPTIPMTIPDFSDIAEVMLAVEGVREYSAMGHAFTTFFQWCKQSLSRQHHYDFGLRALKATVSTTGKLVRAAPERPEAITATDALWSSSLPRFTPADAALAEAEIEALFPDGGAQAAACRLLEEAPATVRTAVEDACGANPAMQAKLAQFLGCLKARHGVGVLTEEPRAVLQTISSVAPLVGAKLVYIGADDRSSEQLLGRMTESGEWRDGSLTAALRMASQHAQDGPTWLVVDGALDAQKMEPLNSLLDDNKKLCLASNEIVPLGRNTSVVFLTGNASTALMSPANVSRLVWVNFDMSPASKGWFW